MAMIYDADSKTFSNSEVGQKNIKVASVLEKVNQLKSIPDTHPSYEEAQVKISLGEVLLASAGYQEGDEVGIPSKLSGLIQF